MARSKNASDIWGRAVSLTTMRLRKTAKLSRKKFEEVSGIDRNQLWFLENREVKVQLKTFERLASGHGMTATEFMAHAETELAGLRKQEPDPFLAIVIKLKSKKKTPRPKAGGAS